MDVMREGGESPNFTTVTVVGLPRISINRWWWVNQISKVCSEHMATMDYGIHAPQPCWLYRVSQRIKLF